MGKKLIQEGYQGLFGLDLIIDNKDKIYLIEINPRQTANIPMQSYLELETGEVPIGSISSSSILGHRLRISNSEFRVSSLRRCSNIQPVPKRSFDINSHVKIGTYRLQSDNSAKDFHLDSPQTRTGVIFLDEEQDKPLIFQHPSYNVTQVGQSGIQILAGEPGKYKSQPRNLPHSIKQWSCKRYRF